MRKSSELFARRFAIELGDLIMRTCLFSEFRLFFLIDGFTIEIDYDKLALIRRHKERPLL